MSGLVVAVRSGLRVLANPDDAPAMRAYMKSAMPFLGVRAPAVKLLCRKVYADHRLPDCTAWESAIRALFDEATYREERYAALSLVGHRLYREFATSPSSLVLFEHLITTGAWWDIVDDVSHRVGDVLLAHRAATTPVMRGWSRSDDLWLRRTSIICQLGHKSETDTGLLTNVIEANIADREFFIRKAIGWALREYARSERAWVLEFVADHGELSPLSKREALKHLGTTQSS
ncbi:MAG: DNA alkylation repair protein [Nocardioidaceae bacterium]